jgi:hypothetical protein
LSYDKKTIKPVYIGGVVGGSKYIVNNILFKFAVDQDHLFRGDDAAAAKVAGHDLKSLISVLNCDLPGLSVPMMLLLDYKGFRLTAMTMLPINKTTLVYGSCDAGRTIYNDDEDIAIGLQKVNRLCIICNRFLWLFVRAVEYNIQHSLR